MCKLLEFLMKCDKCLQKLSEAGKDNATKGLSRAHCPGRSLHIGAFIWVFWLGISFGLLGLKQKLVNFF